MGCFGSKSPKEVESNVLQLNLIATNFQKLSLPFPEHCEREIMKPLKQNLTNLTIRHLPPTQLEELKNLNFPVFSKHPEYLKNSVYSILSSRGYNCSHLGPLIEIIAKNYQDNPFHNFYHGFAVFHMLFVISERNNKFSQYLTQNEERLLLLSGLGHDINHPGVNNGFLINTKHEVAARYNNLAVLENYHAATLVEFLGSSNFNIGVSEEDKEVIVKTILATDMTQHKLVLEDFLQSMKEFDKENSLHKISFMRMLVHGADIGNPALEFDLATIWSLKIIQEFNLQVWKEEQFGVQVSEFMRIGDDMGKIKKSQIMFIDVFILPLWKNISEFLPCTLELVENIEKNRKHWEEIESL